MKDLTIALENRAGALAEMGDALGRAGVSIEGGGAFVVDGRGVAIFFLKMARPLAKLSKLPASLCWPSVRYSCNA